MKLLIYFGFIQIIFAFTLGVPNIYANEVADSYQVRYERWLKQRPLPLKNSKATSPTVAPVVVKKTAPARLPQTLPSKVEPVVQTDTAAVVNPNLIKAEKISATEKTAELAPANKAPNPTRLNPRITPSRRLALDAREEFLNNIPEDNDQVQALLTMVDHTKVYFSINQNGPLKDLFKDERFREIYMEEMKPETRKQTYYFFKGYQDHQRNPNEPVQKSLNRNVLINRERIDSYLETTSIKSKLTRSLQGSYPKLPKPTPAKIPSESSDGGGANLGTE